MSLELQGVHPATQVSVDPTTQLRTDEALSLLADPHASGFGSDAAENAMSMMYTLIAREGQFSLAIGENAITTARNEQNVQLQQEKQAELAEQQAEANQGGFWHDLLSVAEDVAKVAGIVVGVAAVAAASVCTCGAAGVAAVVIAATLISAGEVVSATGCLGKDSDYIGMGMEVVGSVITMGVASGALASDALTEVAHTVSTVAQVTGGAATVVAGASTIEVDHFQGETEDDAADLQQAIDAVGTQGRMIDDLLASLKDSEKSNQNALKLIAGADKTYGQAMILAASAGKA
jgi:hypothetical protein